MKNPQVSIIIPSYNHARYLRTAIDSVLRQTYKNIELIIVDDGSSDESHQIIRSYLRDQRVKAILKSDNRGQSYAVNRGLEISTGVYVGLLASDDWYLPDKIRLQVEKFNNVPQSVGVIYGRGARYYEKTGETVEVNRPMYRGNVAEKFVAVGPFVYPVTPLFRRSCFDKVPMDESFRAEGEAVFARIALHYEFDYVDEVVAVMRDHDSNISKDVSQMYHEVEKIWTSFFAQPDLPANIKKLQPRRMARLHRTKGLQFIGEVNDLSMGRKCLVRAIKAQPNLVSDPRVFTGLMLSLLPEGLAARIITARRTLKKTQTMRTTSLHRSQPQTSLRAKT